MMSYLEGDSLLREIEKSLERDIDLDYEVEDDDEEDITDEGFYQIVDMDDLDKIEKEKIEESDEFDPNKQMERLSNGFTQLNLSSNHNSKEKSKSFSRPSSSFTN